MDPTGFCTELLLNFGCCDIIYDILGTYVPLLCNFCEMELNISSEVFIVEDRRLVCAVTMEGKLFRVKVSFDPFTEIPCMLDAMPHSLCSEDRRFSPRV